MRQATAAEVRKNTAGIIKAPRRMPVAEAVHKYMRVPVGVGNSVEWDPHLAPYVVEPMNCLASREYDAVIFVGPARTGKTISLIDGWVVYNVVCDPSDNDTGLKQNGDGILDVYTNNAHVFRFANGVNNSIQPLRSESYISAKGGVYEFNGSQDVRVYSPHNPPPATDLSAYATMSWVLQNFVQNIDLTAPTEFQFWDGRGYMRPTDGAAMYNFSMVGGSSNVGWIQIRYTRKLVNNTWYVLN